MPLYPHERSVLQPDSFSFVNANAVTPHVDQCLYIVFALVAYLVLFTVSQCEFLWSSFHTRKVVRVKEKKNSTFPHCSLNYLVTWVSTKKESKFCFFYSCYLNLICLCSKLSTNKGIQAFGRLVWCFIKTKLSRSHVGVCWLLYKLKRLL